MKISDIKAIVTGGNSGIGYEIAKQLRAGGALVTICGQDQTTINSSCTELDLFGKKTDVSDEREVQALVDFAVEKMCGLNVLVNNAGVGYMAPLTETDVDAFTKIWEINVKGAMLVARACAIHFVQENTGNIINIASTAGSKGFAGGSAYCSSKFALSALTECWRAELRKNNVRVMQINPSEVVTPFMDEEKKERINPEKKLKPAHIAHAALAMLSMDDVGFITDTTVWASNP